MMPNQNIVILAAAYDSADSNPMVYYAVGTYSVCSFERERVLMITYVHSL